MLSNEQEKVFQLLEKTNKSIFLTGKAGTGKSHLLKYFMNNTKKNVALLAPTGVAAINIGGQTINSFFHIFQNGVYMWKEEKSNGEVLDMEKILDKKSNSYKEMIKGLDTIVIDEVSMVRVDVFYMMDKICRHLRNNNIPFGGIQVVLVGDLYQLPPVAPKEIKSYLDYKYKGIYFFMSPDITKHMVRVQLTEIFRQKDSKFKEVLNCIRVGDNLPAALGELNQRVCKPESMEGVIVLASTNNVVNKYNSERLQSIENKEFTYKAVIEGDLKESFFPTDEIIRLKVGAQIMMLENDFEGRWVNGSVGIVSQLTEDEIRVIIGKNEFQIYKKTWTSIKYKFNKRTNKLEEDETALFIQYPIRLAWAVTIHKSQGQTYDSVYLKMDHAFDYGQTYVALSRCKDLDKLYLENPLKSSDVKIDTLVKDFMD